MGFNSGFKGLRWISDSGMGGMDWIDLVQDRARWQALANAQRTFRFYKVQGIS